MIITALEALQIASQYRSLLRKLRNNSTSAKAQLGILEGSQLSTFVDDAQLHSIYSALNEAQLKRLTVAIV